MSEVTDKFRAIFEALETKHLERVELQLRRSVAFHQNRVVRQTRINAIIAMSAAFTNASNVNIHGSALAKGAIEQFICCDWDEARALANTMLFEEDFSSHPESYGPLRQLWAPFVKLVHDACEEAERFESGKEPDS